MTGSTARQRHVAFYLPQFHPIPENDAWWGTGFTEWRNVARADPLFRGHWQPHVPADLGFYDLRLPETRAAQASLAGSHGIDAFCYFHYWFGGRRLLETPFSEALTSGEPDFPFMLCWANENWTRVWDGKSRELLMRQTYSHDDDLRHVRALGDAFADRRYVRVDGRPVFLVYRATSLPSPQRFAETWRSEAQRLGIGELYLCAVHGGRDQSIDADALGFDAVVTFAPFSGLDRRRHSSVPWRLAQRAVRPDAPHRRHRIYDYATVVADNLAMMPPGRVYPCVSPGFDNSPRRPQGGATIIVGSSPDRYERWVRDVSSRFRPFSPDENFVFVNAWNEWAEGNHLEPSRRFGRQYLEAHRRGRG